MVTFMIMESTSGKHSPTPGTQKSMSSRLGDGEQGCQAIQARPRELEKLFFKRPRALCPQADRLRDHVRHSLHFTWWSPLRYMIY
jgi:hypothetical protein